LITFATDGWVVSDVAELDAELDAPLADDVDDVLLLLHAVRPSRATEATARPLTTRFFIRLLLRRGTIWGTS
jgi:hypothetical protein